MKNEYSHVKEMESEPEHTPGPWTWYWRQTDGEADCSIVSEQYPGNACCVARCPRYQKQEQWRADAPLLSAAPELLAMLKQFLDYVEDTVIDYPDSFLADMHTDAKKIIAKAEGRIV